MKFGAQTVEIVQENTGRMVFTRLWVGYHI